MKDQPAGGHVFNMDGAGADGNATPRFAAYGATKRSLQQVGELHALRGCQTGRLMQQLWSAPSSCVAGNLLLGSLLRCYEACFVVTRLQHIT